MPQSLSSVTIHLVFSTKNHRPFIVGPAAAEIHPYLMGILNNLGCPSIRIGGVADHVHLLFRLSRTRTIAEVVDIVKSNSSKWIKTKGSRYSTFQWQLGYGAFSIGKSETDLLVRYIENQPEHHKKLTWQEEYRRLLERYRIPFDERYVWD
jgi:putative transposase